MLIPVYSNNSNKKKSKLYVHLVTSLFLREKYIGGQRNKKIIIILIILGPQNGFTARFLGFSIYISNTTNKLEGTLCYKDDDFTRSTIPAIFKTTCFVHGQYVIYYNERLPGTIYPTGYSMYALYDLCEVEVYGKQFNVYSFVCHISLSITHNFSLNKNTHIVHSRYVRFFGGKNATLVT